MGEKSDQIERHIKEQRAELGDNIVQLQAKVRDAFNWRVQFENRPMTMIGIALGGGVVLASLFGCRSRSRRPGVALNGGRVSSDTKVAEVEGAGGVLHIEHKSSDGWRNIKAALTGVAAAKFGTILDSFLPGFSEEYDKARKPDRSVSV